MHSPMQSLGERRTQPSTPCSASVELGGRRSIFGVLAVAELPGWRRRDCCKSAAPGSCSRMASLMGYKGNTFREDASRPDYQKMLPHYSPPGQARLGEAGGFPPNVAAV